MGTHYWAVASSGVCTAIAVILSAALIQQHMAHFSKPNVQSKIVGILWMVPIYSVDSWLSLSFKDYALYLDMFRDCYEVGEGSDLVRPHPGHPTASVSLSRE